MTRLVRLRARGQLARAVGPRGAWRLRGQNARLAELRSWRRVVYRRIWAEAAAEVGAELEELGDGFLELRNQGFLRLLRGRTLVTPQDLAVTRDDAGEDFRPAEIDADGVTAAHPERVP